MGSTISQLPGRLRGRLERMAFGDQDWRFKGSYASTAEATAAIAPGRLSGYDHDEIADVSFELMCRVELWDYPVLFWLQRLVNECANVIDAGGHMGTKFRAFRNHLVLPENFDWAVYEVPAIARAGRKRAAADGLTGISFHDRLEDTPPSDLLLGSGLHQYLDIPFVELLARLPRKPRHLILNKVATREGPMVVTLEQFPGADVPYHVRNHADVVNELTGAGYVIRDSWTIAPLSYQHRAFGQSTSWGFYAELA